jgi:predicted nucleic acid-binding protein
MHPPRLLYVDSSALLRRVLDHPDAGAIDAAMGACLDGGGAVVSSRLLWLESRRVAVREALSGNDISAALGATLAGIVRLPLDDEVWGAAMRIEAQIKTLDSLHVATCAVAEATMLSFDATMRRVAAAEGCAVHPIGG